MAPEPQRIRCSFWRKARRGAGTVFPWSAGKKAEGLGRASKCPSFPPPLWRRTGMLLGHAEPGLQWVPPPRGPGDGRQPSRALLSVWQLIRWLHLAVPLAPPVPSALGARTTHPSGIQPSPCPFLPTGTQGLVLSHAGPGCSQQTDRQRLGAESHLGGRYALTQGQPSPAHSVRAGSPVTADGEPG